MYYFLVQTSSQIWFISLVDDCQFPIPPRKIGKNKKIKITLLDKIWGNKKKAKKKKKTTLPLRQIQCLIKLNLNLLITTTLVVLQGRPMSAKC